MATEVMDPALPLNEQIAVVRQALDTISKLAAFAKGFADVAR